MPVFASLRVGEELPVLDKGPVTRQRLVEWCAAENDYYPLHYDERVAERMGLPGTPVQGTFRFALMGQLIERWLGTSGSLRRITAAFRGLDLEGDLVCARGRIEQLTPHAHGGGRVLLSVRVENQRGETSTLGEATVDLVS